MLIDQQKTRNMITYLEGEHFRYSRRPGASPGDDEVDLSGVWSLVIEAPRTPLIVQMESDFREFMRTCMDVQFSDDKAGVLRLTFELAPGGKSKRDEAFSMAVADDAIIIRSAGERGLLHAAHYLEKVCASRGGPFIPKGSVEKKPVFTPRISNTVFCPTDSSLDYPLMFTGRYLSLMSHFGVNGIHLLLRIWDFCRNASLSELNTPDYEANTEALRELCSRAGRYGIDVYPVVINYLFTGETDVFRSRPDVRGALLNYPIDNDQYCLCSSNPDVLSCYKESFTNLVSSVPDLGGLIIMVGGEGFVHCFTRPKAPLVGGTSCPHCSGRNPSSDVANLMNSVSDAVHTVDRDMLIFSWPYSAFTWSGKEDPAQIELIDNLNEGVSFLSNFDTPHVFRLGNWTANLVDYNIVNIGPSEQFKAQTEALRKKGKAHYAKIESSTEPGWFFVPCLPVYYRWAERVRRMEEWEVAGYVSKWRFYGFTGSFSEEILSEMEWNSNIDKDELLLSIARRDFGDVSESILEGWRILSDTWEKIPASHMIYGERNFYMKGPAFLGPAHPLILDVQNGYGLSSRFYSILGCLGEYMSQAEFDRMQANAPPRYSSDLLFTYPFGAAEAEDAFLAAMTEWDRGVRLIEQSIGPNPNDRAQMELDSCRIIGIHLRSVWNVIRFYRARNKFLSAPGTIETLHSQKLHLCEIINDEIENSSRAIAVVERDVRIGYGYCYGRIYDVDTILEKIKQCKYVRDEEIPKLVSGVVFHVYGEYQ